MKICNECKSESAYDVQSYNFDENGAPSLRNGTDIDLCIDCWNREIDAAYPLEGI
jgi:hypothetical protein